MVRVQALNKIRQNLHDNGMTYYSIEDINESIQDAYDEIVIYSECIEKSIDIPVNSLVNTPESANPWTNIRKLIPDYYRLIGVLNQSTRQFLTPQIDREQDELRIDWQLSTGNVYDYVINGPDWVGFPNSYNQTANKPLRVFYKASAPKLTHDNQAFRILIDFQILIEWYCTADLLEQNQELIKAQGYWNQYEPKLDEYRDKIQILSRSDRVFTRG